MDTEQFISALQAFGIVSLLVSLLTAIIRTRFGTNGILTQIIVLGASIILGGISMLVVQYGWGETILALAAASQFWYGAFIGDVQQSYKFQKWADNL